MPRWGGKWTGMLKLDVNTHSLPSTYVVDAGLAIELDACQFESPLPIRHDQCSERRQAAVLLNARRPSPSD